MKEDVPQIVFRDVGKSFWHDGIRAEALARVDLAVKAGEFLCVVGPSGCGKSTLLNMAAGLFSPTKGTVFYGGRSVAGINTSVGYVTQRDHLLPWRTVRANVELPLEIQAVRRPERKERVARALEMVGLTGAASRYPAQLSGGMRSRASLAQTLVYEPETLLMDEPFAALDAQLRQTMQEELLEIWHRHRRTVVFVTHDLEEAIFLGDRVAVITGVPGHLMHVEPIPFPRPRVRADLRRMPRFNEIWADLWSRLEIQGSEA